MKKEVGAWPYSFVASDDFPKSDQRGTVNGKLLVYDRYLCLYLLFTNRYCMLSCKFISNYLYLVVYMACNTDSIV